MTANESRPRMGTGAASESVVTTQHQDTAGVSTSHLIPAPVSDGLASWQGPLMHPDSPEAVWREYGRPPAPPWGSYLDETPLPMPPDRRGPITVMHDALAVLGGVR